MSRVGKKPILIPQGVDVTVDDKFVTVKGPKGSLSRTVHPLVSLALSDDAEGKRLIVSVEDETEKVNRSQWGTARTLISNMIMGVTVGFSKKLEVNGVGYRVNLQGRTLNLVVGYSHEVPFLLPEGITATVDGNVITIIGSDNELVGEIAARIRKVRKPEPYKGKGIKYTDEVVRRKAGKSQKAAA
ncbi:50S ribosomal protein L6 [Candidatus Uhrbacteria bacterium RIFCSPHIGHO2_02_FULL_47_44]|uniref:Large ribosomal subunit protein uL6 n=1 Tax=Candidatus Uhrbacteria bacterium RIFCSPLOWO2_02_FULL_48_18 TaxID=1802408 RepID=A0A1F7V7Z9_9BACT|nr:MAG: 50S ribosomal protein L6 [Candidatus Uhrbacteria bacterium RIFCSPHIGHO2_01_FULL_47_10]OGL70946.1 MAG: 50S ribosomal protein L6 [Candidatus Uhrbacteria bacterium RIFCSPHIGHO2_02_FULL_47_44]OGL76938.1 MAG: 50S ribosomal protein L6 [Candidatus Uhrbacteria bacterium RIFCSPHIGHO2_12_FULL_47_12]OGL80729.1 MAG: 50S ribosomal protein L6 [Candidatus Uhrbacteria bacterium RIFCSPLOWO2_01_FULL_47_17]OGL86619.1 MAG: 50S ribosomal protein L6 [Candidatus Uhrbacteria bacterium RIFCSPLOWO2_02_FULL_48_18